MDPGEIGPGTLVDHFQVIRLLGRGGRGEVHLARDTQLGRLVALKVARPTGRDRLELLLAEARTTARLAHPNIVTIHAVGQHHGRAYLALQYIEGDTLRRRVGALGPDVCIRLGLGVARALDHAHGQGVMHRDLKPENILFGRDGQPRVVDFGLALLDGDTPTETQGTPAYLAPEQRQPGPLTSAVDIWALGVVLHEAATGKRPGDGPVAEEMVAAPVVRRCLEQDPARRPTASEVVAALEDLLPGRRRGPPERPPYPGLRAFAEEDAFLFFGRDRELDVVLETLRHEAAVAVVGPSGVGKTSLVQAGVIPRLRERGELRVVTLRPGPRPLARLSTQVSHMLPEEERDGAALAELLAQGPAVLGLLLEQVSAGGQLLLFVDQLEQLEAALDPADRSALLEAVRSAASSAADGPVRVVLALRDDRIGRLSSTPDGRRLLEQVRIVPLGCPCPEDLRQALVAPLDGTGLRYEEGLVQEMVDAVAGEPTGLALLSFTARALWDHRTPHGDTLCRGDYEAIGGVEGALAAHAEQVMGGLAPDEVQTAREILLRLVDLDGSRHVADEESLLAGLDGPSAGRVLQRLAQGRLVVVHRGDDDADGEVDPARVELVHGSLAWRWPRLRAWLDEGRGRLSLLREVEQTARLWDRRGRQRAELWTDEALAEVRRLLGDGAGLSERARVFLEQSGHRGASARRRRRLLLVLGLAVLASSAALVALTRAPPSPTPAASSRTGGRGERPASWAVRQLAEGYQAFDRARYTEAWSRLREALEVGDSVDARALFFQLARLPGPRQRSLDERPLTAGFTHDGLLVATATRLHSFRGARTAGACGIRGAPRSVSPLPDGEGAVLISTAGEARLLGLDACTSRLLAPGPVSAAAVSPRGDAAALGLATGSVLLARLPGGKASHRQAHDGEVTALAFSPGGRLLATAGADRTVRLWSGRGATLVTMPGHAFAPTALAFGGVSRLASGDRSGVVRIWSCDSGRLERVLSVRQAVRQLAFASDGQLLVSTRAHTSVYHRDGRPGGRVPGRAVALSSDGSRVVTARGLDLLVHTPFARAPVLDRGHTGPVNDVALARSGDRLASAGQDGTVRVWDRSGAPLAVLRGHTGPVSSVVFSPAGTHLFSGGADGDVRTWSMATFREQGPPRHHPARVLRLALAPDGALLAAGTAGGVVHLWRRRRQLGRLEGHRAAVLALAFSTDGARLASGGADRTVRIFRTDDLRAAPRVLVTRAPTTDLLFLDARRLVTASRLGEVDLRRLDATRGLRIASGCGDDPRLALPGDRLAVAGEALRLCRLDGGGCEDRPFPGRLGRPVRVASGEHLLALAGKMGTVVMADHEGAARWRGPRDRSCRHLDGAVERWDRRANRRLWRAIHARPARLLATREGCLTLSRGEARLHLGPTGGPLLAKGAVAIGTGDTPRRALAVATADAVRVFDRRGRLTAAHPVGVGATAVLSHGKELVVGYADGLVTRRSASGTRTLRARHSSPVVSLLVGPRGVLFAGQAGGQLEGWASTGRHIFHAKLHGAVERLASAGDRLVAVTAVGDRTGVDLGLFTLPYCGLLRKLSQGTPADGHRCAGEPR